MSENNEATPVNDAGAPSNDERRSRRRRPRRRRRGGGGSPSDAAQEPAVGFLWRREDKRCVLLSTERSFHLTGDEPLVDEAVVTRWRLESGVALTGQIARGDGRRRPTLVEVQTIEGMAPEEYRAKAVPFADLVCIDPTERFRLETEPGILEPRVIDLLTPIGRGQRCLIVSPPKAGKTTLLQQLAHAIAVNHPDAFIFVLLVDERPEEVTAWRRSVVRGDVVASSSDESVESHIEVSEMVLERARRMVELGHDVVVLMDSLTRMSRAYNNMQKSSGRILSGGMDARTMEKPRRFFGSARNIEGGGSLTIVATCLIDTGSRMDEVIFQEFKGTGNMEIVLSRDLFERRIFPCMLIGESGTRKEEKLYSAKEVERIFLLRRALATLSNHEAMQLLLSKLKLFASNAEFLANIQAPATNGR
jgi:transcription termination factor Rho